MVRAINRRGEEFQVGDIVMMADFPVLYPQMTGEDLVINSINEFEGCESGFQIQVTHKKSGTPFKKKLDSNWFKKI